MIVALQLVRNQRLYSAAVMNNTAITLILSPNIHTLDNPEAPNYV